MPGTEADTNIHDMDISNLPNGTHIALVTYQENKCLENKIFKIKDKIMEDIELIRCLPLFCPLQLYRKGILHFR